MTQTTAIEVPTIHAELNYASDQAARGRYEIYDDENKSSLPVAPKLVEVGDARQLSKPSTLEHEGFTIVEAPTDVTSFDDPGALAATYLPELAEMIRWATGAVKVVTSPAAVVRVTDPAARTRTGSAGPARFVHVDYSDKSAHEFLNLFLSGGSDAGRYQHVTAFNTWRSITPPPQDLPLALCDQRTVSRADLVTADAVYTDGPAGTFEISLTRYNPAHRWFYFRDTRPDELLIFRGYEIAPDAPLGVLHSAFVDPTCPPDVPPRTSVEVRAFALFE